MASSDLGEGSWFLEFLTDSRNLLYNCVLVGTEIYHIRDLGGDIHERQLVIDLNLEPTTIIL